MTKPKMLEKKPKTKTNLQQCILLYITLLQIVPLQIDTKALKVMFPAAKNDWTKNAKNIAKNKTNLLQYISLHITPT